MNKTEFVDEVAGYAGMTKKSAAEAVDAVLGTIERSLHRGHPVAFMGFGTFDVKVNEARDGRNPKTGEKIKVNASRSPKFKPGAALKAAVNGG